MQRYLNPEMYKGILNYIAQLPILVTNLAGGSGSEMQRKIEGQLHLNSIFFFMSMPFSVALLPFRMQWGKSSLLLRNWLCPVLGPDGSPLTFLMCQAFLYPSDQSAVVCQAMNFACRYLSGANSPSLAS